jgi:hypothetical protein
MAYPVGPFTAAEPNMKAPALYPVGPLASTDQHMAAPPNKDAQCGAVLSDPTARKVELTPVMTTLPRQSMTTPVKASPYSPLSKRRGRGKRVTLPSPTSPPSTKTDGSRTQLTLAEALELSSGDDYCPSSPAVTVDTDADTWCTDWSGEMQYRQALTPDRQEVDESSLAVSFMDLGLYGSPTLLGRSATTKESATLPAPISPLDYGSATLPSPMYAMEDEHLNLVVKNTFICVSDSPMNSLRRCKSADAFQSQKEAWLEESQPWPRQISAIP